MIENRLKGVIMKILITGKHSYIGTCFAEYVKGCEGIETEMMSMRGDEWKSADFTGFDSILHVAGIAHADVEHTSEDEQKRYYEVNCDLAYDCALKAKESGVGQFIYLSSMLVYPNAAKLGTSNMITADTPLKPDNFYGDSKVKAEEKLATLKDDFFKIVILRPPMIYGKGSKGNYAMLRKFALKLPLFPDIANERSMLYIENLCEFIRLMVKNGEDGVFFPQNAKYSNTSEMTRQIALVHGKKLKLTKIFNPCIKLLGHTGGKYGKMVCKAFGSLTYDIAMSEYRENYCAVGFEESIKRTEQPD